MSHMLKGFFNAREPRDRDSHGRSSRMGTLDDAENLVFHDLDNNGFDLGEGSGGPPHPNDSKMVDADFFDGFQDDFDEDEMKKAS